MDKRQRDVRTLRVGDVRLGAHEDRAAACEAARQTLEQTHDHEIDALRERFDACAKLLAPKRAALLGADDGARERGLLETMHSKRSAISHGANVRCGAQHDDGEDDAFDAVEPLMADLFGLRGDRRQCARRVEKAHEPLQPKHRPAVKPLEAKIGNGFGDKAHGVKRTPASTLSNWKSSVC